MRAHEIELAQRRAPACRSCGGLDHDSRAHRDPLAAAIVARAKLHAARRAHPRDVSVLLDEAERWLTVVQKLLVEREGR